MVNIVKCIAGFTFLVIRCYETPTSAEIIAGCDVEFDGNGDRKADCCNKGINRIPRYLGANVKILDVSSNNPKFTLYSDDLKSYPNLLVLIMRNLTSVRAFPAGFFQPTAHLEVLNISDTKISSLKEIPTTIKILNFTRCDVDSIDLPHLDFLEELFLKQCKLHKFPSIPKLAPLRVVDMRQCPLTDTNYSHLAPFCQLRYFGFLSTALNQSDHTLECCGLREWGRMWKIFGTNIQTCFKNKTHRKCSDFVTIRNDAVQEYRACYARLGLRRFILFIVILSISLILLTALVAVLLHFFRKSHSKHKTETDRKASSTIQAQSANQEPKNIETEGDTSIQN